MQIVSLVISGIVAFSWISVCTLAAVLLVVERGFGSFSGLGIRSLDFYGHVCTPLVVLVLKVSVVLAIFRILPVQSNISSR